MHQTCTGTKKTTIYVQGITGPLLSSCLIFFCACRCLVHLVVWCFCFFWCLSMLFYISCQNHDEKSAYYEGFRLSKCIKHRYLQCFIIISDENSLPRGAALNFFVVHTQLHHMPPHVQGPDWSQQKEVGSSAVAAGIQRGGTLWKHALPPLHPPGLSKLEHIAESAEVASPFDQDSPWFWLELLLQDFCNFWPLGACLAQGPTCCFAETCRGIASLGFGLCDADATYSAKSCCQ